MKKTYIQYILISLTILFLGITAFYYWQSLQVTKISHNQVIEDKKIITEEIVSKSTPLFDEPILEDEREWKKTSTLDENIVEEIVLENEEIIQEEEIVKESSIEQETENLIENTTEKINNTSKISLSSFSIDLYSDSSIQKFVGNEVSFSDVSYIPEDLVSFSWPYIIDAKWNWQMRREAIDTFEKLSESFYAEFWEKIVVVSTYRSYLYQKWIKDRGCPDNLCAKAWYSEHQWWLAIDLWEASTNAQFLGKPDLKKYYEWLMRNASLYWFHNSYQKWKAIDWYDIEPWHWRYVWEELATYLIQNNMTFTEFYNLQLRDEA